MDDSSRITALQAKVGELERRLDFVMRHLELDYEDESLSPAVTEAADRLRKGDKLEAIKVYREMTGAGLKESKEAGEVLEKALRAG